MMNCSATMMKYTVTMMKCTRTMIKCTVTMMKCTVTMINTASPQTRLQRRGGNAVNGVWQMFPELRLGVIGVEPLRGFV